jgi:hypothetical protein
VSLADARPAAEARLDSLRSLARPELDTDRRLECPGWRMPHWLLHPLGVSLAGVLFGVFALPYRLIHSRDSLCSVAENMPLGYADYWFQVRVNDQFDRFSAPIERRYEPEDVEQRLMGAGLVETRGTGHFG